MRHVLKCETLNVLLLAVLFSSLIFAPLFQDTSLAQTKDVDPPYISHHPSRIAIQGKPVNVVAHIFDDSQIASVTITLNQDGKSVTGNLPKRKTPGPVPVVGTILKDVNVLSKANPSSKIKGQLSAGEAVNVTRVQGQYYRIRTPMNIAGYVNASDCEVVVEGAMYGIAIPASMTSGSDLSYQITATDIYGNEEKSELVQVTILTQNDLMALRSGKKPSKSIQQTRSQSQGQKGGIGFKKAAIVTGVAVAGGGAYYLYSQKDKDKLNVTIEMGN